VLSYFNTFKDCLEVDTKKVIFSSDIENTQDFYKYVRKKYNLEVEKAGNIDHAIIQNERLKFANVNKFNYSGNVVVDYKVFDEFSSFYDTLKYLFPINIEKYKEGSLEKMKIAFKLEKEDLKQGLKDGWITAIESQERPYKVSNTCLSQYRIIDYYSASGEPVFYNDTQFVEDTFRLYFDKKVPLKQGILDILE